MKTSFCFRFSLLISLTAGFTAFGDPAFTDGFEAASINPFWTVVQSRGTVLPVTTAAHTGQRAVQMRQTVSGQMNLQLIHTFSSPQYGTISVWFNSDSGSSYYSSCMI